MDGLNIVLFSTLSVGPLSMKVFDPFIILAII